MELNDDLRIKRSGHYAETVVFVDGLWGSGKTMLSPIIATMNRVELLSYSYETEYMCSLHYLGRMPIDAASSMVKMQIDLKLYNCMMGRDVNFRPTDLSSALMDVNPGRYFRRLFESGDEFIPEQIEKEKPILHIATHNILPFAGPIIEGLGKRAKFIEVVRHPLFMVKQQALNMENLIGGARDFTVYYEKDGNSFPYYVKGWEKEFLEASPVEKAIVYQDRLTKMSEECYKKPSEVLVIPFEKFVVEPDEYMRGVENLFGTEFSDLTPAMLKKQNVPRTNIVSSIDLEIYRRCGWTPPVDDLTEKGELKVRYEYVKKNARPEYVEILDKLIAAYERDYWSPSFLPTASK